MPEYLYQHPKTEKIVSIIQSVHDKHEYIDDKNIKWNRIFTAPELNTEGTLKADCSARQFSEFVGKRNDTSANANQHVETQNRVCSSG
jgi:hypothetical protein